MPAFAYLAAVARRTGCPPMFVEEAVQEIEVAIWLHPGADWKMIAHRTAIDFVRTNVSDRRSAAPQAETEDIAGAEIETPDFSDASDADLDGKAGLAAFQAEVAAMKPTKTRTALEKMLRGERRTPNEYSLLWRWRRRRTATALSRYRAGNPR